MVDTPPNPQPSVNIRNVNAGKIQIANNIQDSSELYMSVDDHAHVLRTKMAAESRVRNDVEKRKLKMWLIFPGIPLVIGLIAVLIYPQILPMTINAIAHEIMASVTQHKNK